MSKDPEGDDCLDASGDGGFNEDDANLIAAAPDLLEALDGVLASLSEYRMRVKRIPFNVAVDANNAEITARAAIAKARGQ